MTMVKDLIENKLENIAYLSKHLNMNTIQICSIVIDETFECEVLQLENPSKLVYIEIGHKFFIETLLNNPNHDF